MFHLRGCLPILWSNLRSKLFHISMGGFHRNHLQSIPIRGAALYCTVRVPTHILANAQSIKNITKTILLVTHHTWMRTSCRWSHIPLYISCVCSCCRSNMTKHHCANMCKLYSIIFHLYIREITRATPCRDRYHGTEHGTLQPCTISGCFNAQKMGRLGSSKVLYFSMMEK